METLVENQEHEEQVNVNETEKVQGGGSCGYINDCGWHFADEDNSDNIAF
jgi:hypothetical protein